METECPEWPAPAVLIALAETLPSQPMPTDPQIAAATLVAVDKLRAALAAYKSDVAASMWSTMPSGTMIVDGHGGFTRARGNKRKTWKKDDLLRRVLDSFPLVEQRVADPVTGEITTKMVPDPDRMDETPLEKVLACWNLDAPRTTVLRERGIDPDEFCETEDGAKGIKIEPAAQRAMQ